MRTTSTALSLAGLATLLMTAGCSYHETKEVAAPPQTVVVPASPRNYDLIDPSGNRYGTVNMDTSGRGHMYDNGGTPMGDIVPLR